MAALIRARHPQMLLALLAERHAAAHAKVMAALGCAPKLTQALPVEWLPVEPLELVGPLEDPDVLPHAEDPAARTVSRSANEKRFSFDIADPALLSPVDRR